MNHIFDTHAHYSSRQFDADRAALLKAKAAVALHAETPEKAKQQAQASADHLANALFALVQKRR